MPVNIPGGFMHVIFPFKLNVAGKPFSTTCGFAINGTSAPSASLAAFDTAWRTAIVGITDSNTQVQPAVGYYRTPGGDLLLVESSVAAQNGTAAQASAPPSVTLCVRKRTEFVGKNRRGRFYLPIGLSETAVDEGGTLTPATVTAVQGRFNTLLSDWVDPDVTGYPVLLHADPSMAPDPILSFVVQPIVRTQRRRLPRG